MLAGKEAMIIQKNFLPILYRNVPVPKFLIEQACDSFESEDIKNAISEIDTSIGYGKVLCDGEVFAFWLRDKRRLEIVFTTSEVEIHISTTEGPYHPSVAMKIEAPISATIDQAKEAASVASEVLELTHPACNDCGQCMVCNPYCLETLLPHKKPVMATS